MTSEHRMHNPIRSNCSRRTFAFYAKPLRHFRILGLLVPAALRFINKVRGLELFIVAAENRVELECVRRGLLRRGFWGVCTVWRHCRGGEDAENIERGNFRKYLRRTRVSREECERHNKRTTNRGQKQL